MLMWARILTHRFRLVLRTWAAYDLPKLPIGMALELGRRRPVRSLRLLSTGPDVVALQKALLAAGFNPGEVDGSFGGGTEAALIAFQRSEGLLDDGVAGPKTAKALGLDGFGEPPDVT